MSDRTLAMYRAVLRKDFGAFVHRSFLELNPQTKFLPNWHIELIVEKLEAVRRGEIRRLIINLPPRHLKSHAASIAFPAWLLGHNPSAQVLCVSYAQDLADKLARDCRTLINSPFYRALFETHLSSERQAVADFETTRSGYRLSTSVGGVLTGRGADIIILDDPLKADDGLSEVRRKTANDWYDTTLYSRLNNKETGAIVLVMQRLHMDDLVAHVQHQEAWDVLSFPALAQGPEVHTIRSHFGQRTVSRKTDEALHPARESRATLEVIRGSTTEYNFVAQYLQNPQPPAGVIVKREWLKFYGPHELPERFDTILQSWDTANTVGELSSYSVCTTWGVLNWRYYLLDVFRERLELPELKRKVRELSRAFKAQVVLVENKASGTQLLQELRHEGVALKEAPKIDGDKIMRLHMQTAKFESGFVWLPERAPWLDVYILEITTFPNSPHFDQVDSTVYALAWGTEQQNIPGMGLLLWTKAEADKVTFGESQKQRRVRLKVIKTCLTYYPLGKAGINVPPDGLIEVDEEDVHGALAHLGGERID